nr:PREDICTED: putative ammonium transporter 1 isoform X1 [Bemisia tabaci]
MAPAVGGNDTDPLRVQLESLMVDVDDFFMITCGIIIAVMQAGFACLEAGAIHAKNVTNILLKNYLDTFICCVFYWALGYALAYGPGDKFIGAGWWASVGLPAERNAHWFFQFIFAATAATIVSGAVAERCNFIAYLIYSATISAVIYPIASHWVWADGGWLAEMGYSDFAGAGVVHMLAGTLSFIAAQSIGPRIDRFKNGAPPGHSTPLVSLGALLLVVGFLAFNGGSLGHISHPGDSAVVAQVINNTIMGGSGGAIVILLASRIGFCGDKKWSFMNTINAGLAGMVSICGGADQFYPWASFVVGIVGSFVYIIIHHSCIKLKVDDPLDCTAVHFGGGFWGVLATGLLTKNGVLLQMSHESLEMLWHQFAGAMIIMVWAAITGIILFYGLKSVHLYRVSAQEELQGLDLTSHVVLTYPCDGWVVTSKDITHGQYRIFRERIDGLSHNEVTYPPEAWKMPTTLPQGFQNENAVIGKPSYVSNLNILHKQGKFYPQRQTHDNMGFEMRGGRE